MLKILVAYHKKTTLFKNDIFIPIHLGRTLKEKETKDGKVLREEYNWLIENMIGDDTGDNISDKNREYCELTGIYWAWKNYYKLGNPDYIGFMHYRRLLVFNEYEYDKYEQTKINKAYRDIFDNFNNDNLLDKYGLNLETINKYIQKYDLILPLQAELKIANTNSSREDYAKNIEGVNVEDYDKMVEYICKNYPEYKDYILEQRDSSRRYFYQMFIIKKNLFLDYCDFLFSVLDKLDKVIDTSNYSINGKRTLAYLGEALFDLYMRKLTNEANIKYKELGIVKIVEDIEEDKEKENIFLGIKRSRKYFIIYLFGFRIVFKKK
ncbi:DUF4422 domain-containing protein [Brachyspira sp.]|uniref:DUF4422 domain-containing protein n=1 Tax=Brachyspira sp. TaxID=1977261 RepID=UPI003D7CE154